MSDFAPSLHYYFFRCSVYHCNNTELDHFFYFKCFYDSKLFLQACTQPFSSRLLSPLVIVSSLSMATEGSIHTMPNDSK